MTQMTRSFRSVLLAATLAFSAISPLVAMAQETPPLVVIRFNQPHVYYDQSLYSAVAKALAVKPDVMFDVVSAAPSTGDSSTDKKWQAIAGHNTRAVINSMQQMGVPMERINVVGQSQPGLHYDETQVFVR